MSAIQNKLRSKHSRNESDIDILSHWLNRIWTHIGGNNFTCGTFCKNPVVGCGLRLGDVNLDEDLILDEYSIYETLLSAENELDALKKALDVAKKLGIQLLQNVQEVEKEKAELELKSLEENMKTQREIEQAKTDLMTLKQQLESLKKERDAIVTTCKNLHEEAMKASDALKSRQIMQEKLEEALEVVAVLKTALIDLENNRNYFQNNFKEEMEKMIGRIGNKIVRYPCYENLHLLGQGDGEEPENQVQEDEWDNCRQQEVSDSLENCGAGSNYDHNSELAEDDQPNMELSAEENDQGDQRYIRFTSEVILLQQNEEQNSDEQNSENEENDAETVYKRIETNNETFNADEINEIEESHYYRSIDISSICNISESGDKESEGEDADEIKMNSRFQLINSDAFKQFLQNNFGTI